MNLNYLKEFFMKKKIPKPENIISDKNIYSILFYQIIILFMVMVKEKLYGIIFKKKKNYVKDKHKKE